DVLERLALLLGEEAVAVHDDDDDVAVLRAFDDAADVAGVYRVEPAARRDDSAERRAQRGGLVQLHDRRAQTLHTCFRSLLARIPGSRRSLGAKANWYENARRASATRSGSALRPERVRSLVEAEGGDERFLGDFDAPDLLHALL